MITLASAITRRAYRDSGLNAAKMAIEGLDPAAVRALVEKGYA